MCFFWFVAPKRRHETPMSCKNSLRRKPWWYAFGRWFKQTSRWRFWRAALGGHVLISTLELKGYGSWLVVLDIFLIFIPNPGEIIQFDEIIIFRWGWKLKPPTRKFSPSSKRSLKITKNCQVAVFWIKKVDDVIIRTNNTRSNPMSFFFPRMGRLECCNSRERCELWILREVDFRMFQ